MEGLMPSEVFELHAKRCHRAACAFRKDPGREEREQLEGRVEYFVERWTQTPSGCGMTLSDTHTQLLNFKWMKAQVWMEGAGKKKCEGGFF